MEIFDFMSKDGCFYEREKKGYLVPLLLCCMLGCYFVNILWLRLLDGSFLRSICLFPIIVTFRLHLEVKVCGFYNYDHFLYDDNCKKV